MNCVLVLDILMLCLFVVSFGALLAAGVIKLVEGSNYYVKPWVFQGVVISVCYLGLRWVIHG